MPTAGRLVGAITFALLGAYLAYLTAPLFKEGRIPSYWWPLTIGAGLWAGWVVVGARVGRGYRAAMGNGITGIAAQIFWILFVLSAVDMIKKSLRKSYDNPLEAVVNVFELGAEHAVVLGTKEVIVFAIAAAIVSAVLAEYFSRRIQQ
jgi:hypothetical protein